MIGSPFVARPVAADGFFEQLQVSLHHDFLQSPFENPLHVLINGLRIHLGQKDNGILRIPRRNIEPRGERSKISGRLGKPGRPRNVLRRPEIIMQIKIIIEPDEKGELPHIRIVAHALLQEPIAFLWHGHQRREGNASRDIHTDKYGIQGRDHIKRMVDPLPSFIRHLTFAHGLDGLQPQEVGDEVFVAQNGGL